MGKNHSEYTSVIEDAMTYIAENKKKGYQYGKAAVSIDLVNSASEKFCVPVETLIAVGQFNIKDK